MSSQLRYFCHPLVLKITFLYSKEIIIFFYFGAFLHPFVSVQPLLIFCLYSQFNVPSCSYSAYLGGMVDYDYQYRGYKDR